MTDQLIRGTPPTVYRVFSGSAPAAGAEILEFVPSEVVWKIYAVIVRFTNDADANGAANPRLELEDDGANLIADSQASGNIADGATTSVVFRQLPVENSNDGGRLQAQAPFPLVLPPDSRITTVTNNIQGTDQYDAPRILVEEYRATNV